MDERTINELKKEVPTDFQKKLLKHCVSLVELSRSKMSKQYRAWDEADDTYQGNRIEDDEDKKARNRKEPGKAVMPITKAQIESFVAFGFSVIFQRDVLFELRPFGSDQVRAAKVGEQLLQRDFNESNGYNVVWQYLLDIARFGLGVLKNSWVERYQVVKELVPAEPRSIDFLGTQIPVPAEPVERRVRKLKYQGNELTNVSPYRFFPDPRYPVIKFQKGEFCATEDEYTYSELKGMEADKMVAGIDHVSSLKESTASEGRLRSRLNFTEVSDRQREWSESGGTGILTEVIVKLIPSKWKLSDGVALSDEDRPTKYLVWYVNDSRIVRVEPFEYAHDEFPFGVAQMTSDMHHFINQGIASSISALQEIISWFINSHITSVRKVIQNQLVVDPKGVNMDDVAARRPVIRLKDGMSRSGVEKWIHQLQLQDVTGGHVQDAKELGDLVQTTTGINDNALGQYHSGRRSALEARNVNSSVAARLKTILSTIYYSGIKPIANQMLQNLREGLEIETFVRLFGPFSDPGQFIEFHKVTSADLVGDYDFELFDGTLPTEKIAMSNTLQELLSVLYQRPDLALLLQLDVRALTFELLRLRNIRHPEQFTLTFEQQRLLMTQMMVQQQAQAPQKGTNGNGNVQNGNSRTQVGAPQGVGSAPLLPGVR